MLLSPFKANNMKKLTLPQFIEGFEKYQVTCFSKDGLSLLYEHLVEELQDFIDPELFDPYHIKDVFGESTAYELVESFNFDIDDNQPLEKFKPLVIEELKGGYNFIGETKDSIVHVRNFF